MDRHSQLQASIESRLKWASGANPALSSVLKNFDNAVEERKNILVVCTYIVSGAHVGGGMIRKMSLKRPFALKVPA